VSPVLLPFLLGLTVALLAVSGALLLVNVATTEPLAEPTRLGRITAGVFASAALPVLVMLAGSVAA
jgi:hypothetical protein